MLFTWFIRMIFGAFDVSNLYSLGYILGCAGDTGLLAYHGWTQIVDVAKSENLSTNLKSLENLFFKSRQMSSKQLCVRYSLYILQEYQVFNKWSHQFFYTKMPIPYW